MKITKETHKLARDLGLLVSVSPAPTSILVIAIPSEYSDGPSQYVTYSLGSEKAMMRKITSRNWERPSPEKIYTNAQLRIVLTDIADWITTPEEIHL